MTTCELTPALRILRSLTSPFGSDLIGATRKKSVWFFRTVAPSVIKIDPNLLTRIILGKDMSPRHRAQIKQWTTRRTPPLVIAEACWDECELALLLKEHRTGQT